jgi:predicted dehydrogenase
MAKKRIGISRRSFLASAGAASSFFLLPRGASGAEKPSPNNKLNVAFIGMGEKIQGHVSALAQHNVVAFCDVDGDQIDRAKKRHGKRVGEVKSYADYRKLIDKEKSLDAVVIATPDHWHAPICKRALEAGIHVYCEKPLTHTVSEARMLRELSRKSKVVTQMGNQGSASDNLRRSIELIRAGLFGEISEVHAWYPTHHRWPSGVKRPEGKDPIPAGLNWDAWCGPAPLRPYKKVIYHPAQWRGWFDFGSGSLGDFCCHAFNLPVRALDLDYPERIEVSGTKLGLESYPKACTTRLRFPATDKRGPVAMCYYSGGDMPPKEVTRDLIGTFGKVPAYGCLLRGSKGLLQAGLWNRRCYVKLNGEKKFFHHAKHAEAKKVPVTIPRCSVGHLGEWVEAIRTGSKTYSDFDRGGHLTEIGLAGVVALRAQKNIAWDGPKMKAPGTPEADAYIHARDRTKWL